MAAEINGFAAVVAKGVINPEIMIDLIFRLMGAGFGAAMALVFEPPRTKGGFWRRAIAGIGCGLLFAGKIRDEFGFSPGWEGEAQAAAVAAFVSWFAMGAIVRAIKGWRR